MHTQLRFTGPNGAPYELGQTISVYAERRLLATVEATALKNGTELALGASTATPLLLDDERNPGGLIFYELCAFITEHFPQVQAIPFAWMRPIGALGPPSSQAATRVAVAERVGATDIRVVALDAGGYAVYGVWPYSPANVAALHEAIAAHRLLYRDVSLVREMPRRSLWRGLRRWLALPAGSAG